MRKNHPVRMFVNPLMYPEETSSVLTPNNASPIQGKYLIISIPVGSATGAGVVLPVLSEHVPPVVQLNGKLLADA